jgi:hypothetical protein
MTERLEALTADEAYDAPDWDAQREDLACPLCGYNLRGLREPRCPECGYRFAWADLTDPARRLHPYLFEHHPERNWRSFWKTAAGGMRPVGFWTSLLPTHPSRRKRLQLYWAVVMLVTFVGAAAPYLSESFVPRIFDTFPHRARSLRGLIESVGPAYFLWWAWGCAWPWLTFAAMMAFRRSMSRAAVKPIHVLRCVLYSSDAMLWGGLALTAMSFLFWGGPRELMPFASAVTFVLVALAIEVRLCVAYERYLHFDHPWATVIASQIVVGLVGINLWVAWNVWR